jgi:hypothetical protein
MIKTKHIFFLHTIHNKKMTSPGKNPKKEKNRQKKKRFFF